MSYDDESDVWRLDAQLRNPVAQPPKRIPRAPQQQQPTGHSTITTNTPTIHLDDAGGFIRELATLAGTVLKTKTTRLRERINAFGHEMFPKKTHVRQMSMRADANRAPPQSRPSIAPRTAPTLAQQQTTTSTIGSDEKKNRQFRNWTLVSAWVYCAAILVLFILLALLRIFVFPTLSITGTLFTGLLFTVVCAITTTIAWNSMSGIFGKAFFAATILLQLAYAALLSTHLRWGTIIACAATLLAVFTAGILVILTVNPPTRKGEEAFIEGIIFALALLLIGSLYFISAGGYGYLGWTMFGGAVAASLLTVRACLVFYWEADTVYEGLDYITGWFLAFGKFAFLVFFVLALIMGTLISLKVNGLSFGLPLFWTDIAIAQITIPGSAFATIF
jgi:hypothetical protein